MKTVRIYQGKVAEIIPEYALPIKNWYGETFAKSCVEAPDEVQQNWVYNSITGEFSEPSKLTHVPTIEELQAENKLLKVQLQAQSDRSDFIEDCIAEMATQVYGDV